VAKQLRCVKGIGSWTIETTILTSFLDWDIFPSGDLFIRKKIQKLYNLNKTPTIKQTNDISVLFTLFTSST
jgi:3-methyladenine DNA glycosylase/8-oxoguanine DNA glycosylase